MASILDGIFGAMGSSSNDKLWISMIEDIQGRCYNLKVNDNFGYMNNSLNVFNGAGDNITATIEKLENIVFFDENGYPYDETTLDELRLGYKFYIEGLQI